MVLVAVFEVPIFFLPRIVAAVVCVNDEAKVSKFIYYAIGRYKFTYIYFLIMCHNHFHALEGQPLFACYSLALCHVAKVYQYLRVCAVVNAFCVPGDRYGFDLWQGWYRGNF